MSGLPPFTKPWLDWDRQLERLESRGLAISDRAAARDFLSHVNYYRFSGYCVAFEERRHQFRDGTTFDDVRGSYEFDRVLRDLLTDALEVVEVDLRTTVAYEFGRTHGAFGHTQRSAFHDAGRHEEWLDKIRKEVDRSRERFVEHFRSTYREFPDLPIWAATEIMSFGSLSHMFGYMKKTDQRAIASRYQLQPDVARSWLHHLTYVRNVCAHHARLWDRVWTIKPRIPHGNLWSRPSLPGNERQFVTLLMLRWMLRRCAASNPFEAEWRDRVEAHLATLPNAPNAAELMGLPDDWTDGDLWA